MSEDIHRSKRGAEWNQWDLHVHTPASFHWDGERFEGSALLDVNKPLIDKMIVALNEAKPAVFALMDYWTFDGWFALKQRLKDNDAPKLRKKVFPGIELRLAAPTQCRLNAHVIFSDEIPDQILKDFRSTLQVEIIKRPLSDDALIELARKIGDDMLLKHSFRKAEVDIDDLLALHAGSSMAELSVESYRNAIEKVPQGQAIGFMPYDTSDGLAEVKWHEHYAYFLELFKTSPIFESRNADLRGAFVNEETSGNKKWIGNFQTALGNVPRLVVSGSDAHRFKGIAGDNNKRGYGDYPSGKITWIKADTTFQGLQQAVLEPAKRSFIGSKPGKMQEVEENKTFFIDSISARRLPDSNAGKWLDNVSLPLNQDLVAIIGNKGSGKSALADVIALLGNSRQKAHFSFLKKERFRGKSGDPAKQFEGSLVWLDGAVETRNLNEDPPTDKTELVRYIPQGHFEELCNAHVSGRSDAFERELRSVIFSHADESIRLGALDFDQLIDQQESSFRDQLNEFRKDLRRRNQEIAAAEAQLQPDVRRAIQALLGEKQRQIDEHKKLRPAEVVKPTDDLSAEQKIVAAALSEASEKLKNLDEKSQKNLTLEQAIAAKAKATQNIKERLRLLERAYKQFSDETEKDFEILDASVTSVAELKISQTYLDQLTLELPKNLSDLREVVDADAKIKQKLIDEQVALKAKLDAPQLLYQEALKSIEIWDAKLKELVGNADSPETLKGLEARLAQLEMLPKELHTYQEQRIALSGEIFDILDAQRRAREKLFKPVQDLISKNALIREEYKLQFQASLIGTPDTLSAALFSLVKQSSGEFRGEDDSYSTVKKLAEQHNFSDRQQALLFVKKLYEKLVVAAGKDSIGIEGMMRKDRAVIDVYDLIFGLDFLEPRYTLLFQDAQIEQLSPGQRGALLLIFYLLVDIGRAPIILDQPEENLDNETVVSLLVPVLTEAKKRRQIIMVTHNPNLAVVCDAEQVIWSKFDRKSESQISYVAGAIENPMINGGVVDVLEGTKPAFNNRKIKYQ